mmetsp:Transcript_14449/g.44609  ORF Transcript_14449/g.44609 Transcript_14449/m.44609 type:complete len:342 (+) Transcript_14449:283-1308(+)
MEAVTKPSKGHFARMTAKQAASHALIVVFFVAASCGFTGSQELIVETPGFKPLHRAFLTLSHSLSYCTFAAIELLKNGWSPAQRRTPLRDYAVVAVLSFCSVFLANSSLGHIDYSTRVMIKCSKPVPTMLLSVALMGRDRTSYGALDYAGALLLGVGLSVAIVGDAGVGGAADGASLLVGLCLAGASVVSDCLVATFEQWRVFSRDPPPAPAELMLYTYAMASTYSLVAFLASDEPALAYAFLSRQPRMLAKMLTSEVFGYASIGCVVRLVAAFGATNAELAKTTRKAVVFLFSFCVIEGRALGAAQARGACVFVAGTLLLAYTRRRAAPKLARVPTTEPL